MSSPSQVDRVMHALATLPVVPPEEARARRVRARCRALLERPPRRMPATVEPGVAAVCGVYAWQIVRIVVRHPPW